MKSKLILNYKNGFRLSWKTWVFFTSSRLFGARRSSKSFTENLKLDASFIIITLGHAPLI